LKGGDVQDFQAQFEDLFTSEENTLLQGLPSIGGTRKTQIF
jgi:hypothetical protein